MTEEYKPGLRRRFAALTHKAPLMMDCPAFEAMIDDYIDDNLGTPRRVRFDLHLLICRECRQYLDGYINTIAVANKFADVPLASMGMGDVSEEFMDKIIAQQTKPR